jgi:hypothetical protein
VAGFALTMPEVRPNRSLGATSQRPSPPTGRDALPERYRLHLRLGLIALCAVLIGTAAVAADNEPGQLHVGIAVQADQGVEALLSQLERQVTVGRTMAPEGDNALATWRRVLEVVSQDAPATLRALADFAADTRRQASEAQAIGQPVVASDLMVFAEEATQLIQLLGIEVTSSLAAAPSPVYATAALAAPPSTMLTDIATQGARPSQTPKRSPKSAAPAESQRSNIDGAQVPLRGSAGTSGSVALAALSKEATTLTPVVGNIGAAPAVPIPHPGMMTRPPGEQAAAAALVSRGDAMLAIKDISAARVFYEYAAYAGNARAALALAETYDVDFLNQLDAVGPKPDPAMAADWYRKAAALGDRDAEVWLRTLGAQAALVHQ